VEKIYLSSTVIRIIREGLVLAQMKRVEFRNLRSSGKTASREGQSRALYREIVRQRTCCQNTAAKFGDGMNVSVRTDKHGVWI
jgi:hypothetical protein